LAGSTISTALTSDKTERLYLVRRPTACLHDELAIYLVSTGVHRTKAKVFD
jgi:hypothetical protein